MRQIRIPAAFMRGGTSNALVFHEKDLPADRTQWDAIFLAAIGSPDPNGRQLNGMGGGISSLSKVCVIGPPSRDDADIDYTFAQVSVRDAQVAYGTNCGNMSSAMGPFAVDEGLVPVSGEEALVRIHNTNTNKIIHSRFALDEGSAAVDGVEALPGVAGTGAPVRLEFLDPGGAGTGRLLPTGNVVDTLYPEGYEPVQASLVDSANPAVFVTAADLGLSGTELPADLDARADLMERLQAIRQAGGDGPAAIAQQADNRLRISAAGRRAVIRRTRIGRFRQPDRADGIHGQCAPRPAVDGHNLHGHRGPHHRLGGKPCAARGHRRYSHYSALGCYRLRGGRRGKGWRLACGKGCRCADATAAV